MSASPKLITLVSIGATLALGPLIWLVATVVAPALLPRPEPKPLQLIPVRPRPSPPPTLEATILPADPSQSTHGTPEPIADRWRYRADGSLEFPLERYSHVAVPSLPRSHQ